MMGTERLFPKKMAQDIFWQKLIGRAWGLAMPIAAHPILLHRVVPPCGAMGMPPTPSRRRADKKYPAGEMKKAVERLSHWAAHGGASSSGAAWNATAS